MKPIVSSRLPKEKWRGLAILFLSLLPALAVFHLVMWFGFTRTLFGPEVGTSKRIGYLVGLKNCLGKIDARQPQSGFSLVDLGDKNVTTGTRLVYFGDSFSGHLAKACSIQWHEPVGSLRVDWSQKNGVSQIMDWVRSGWFQSHGVKVIVIERLECEWLDTFSDLGDSSLDVPLDQIRGEGGLPSTYQKAQPWTFANNGNFKVVIDNFAYLFSPTAFDMTDTVMVHLDKNFFECSYGKLLLFYRGEITRGISDRPKNLPRFEQALANLKAVSDLCHQQGLAFYLIVPPNKSTLYYDWIEKPFFPKSKTLEMLREQATPYGYVDLEEPLHQKLEDGAQDLYYPDDHHWTYDGGVIAAEALTKAGAGPAP